MSDIVEVQERPVVAPPAQAPTPSTLLAMAVQQGADLDKLERLMALQERWEANEARKAFTEAMTAFKAEPLTIFKNRSVGYTTKDNEFVGYKHASLDEVVSVVVPAMARHGLSHRWGVRQDSGRIFVTCFVTHRAGHSESVGMDAAPDNSGKKNPIQQVASSVTFMQRYTLLAITGLATTDPNDDDGRGSGGAEEACDEVLQPLLDQLQGITDDTAARDFWLAHRAKTGEPKTKRYEAFKKAVEARRISIQQGAPK